VLGVRRFKKPIEPVAINIIYRFLGYYISLNLLVDCIGFNWFEQL